MYLFLCSKYGHMSALKQMTYSVCNICTQYKQQSARMYLLHVCDISDLLMDNIGRLVVSAVN